MEFINFILEQFAYTIS